MRDRLWIFGVSLLVLFAFASGEPVSAAPSATPKPYPPSSNCSVSTSAPAVQPGEQITVTGSGFPKTRTVTLTMTSGARLVVVQTDADGSFKASVTIPPTAKSTDKIIASSGSTTCTLSSFAVRGTQVNRTPPTHSVSSTAYTGFAAITATIIALALVAGGLLFVVIGRKRKV